MSANPGYPDAHPTAPGGMSEKALVAELVDRHDWAKADAESMNWPGKIDAVVQMRRKEEVQTRLAATTLGPEDFGQVGVAAYETDEGEPGLDPEPYTDDESDTDDEEFAALLAEFEGESVSVIEEVVHDVKAGLFVGMPGTKDYIFDGHRGAGPSAAERWMACTASLGAARAFLETLTPNQQREFASGNTAARQGTTAHAAAEVEARVILGEVTPEEAEQTLLELTIMPPVEEEAYDEEMAEYITEYTDLITGYVHEGREVLIERRVTATIPLLTSTDGEQDLYDITGSADLIVMPDPVNTNLVVGDLKYGEGIDVDVEENPQIRIYALGALAEVVEVHGGLPDWLTHVEYVIVQPRLGGIKVWVEEVDSLLDWQDEVLSKALTEALGGAKAGAEFVPGDVQCQWCPVRGSCPALSKQRVEQAADLFDIINDTELTDAGFPETGSMTDRELGALYTQITGLTKIASDMKEELQRRMYRGREVPGWVLVNYTPRRTWKDGAEDELKYGSVVSAEQYEELLVTKLVSPTAAEKLLGEDYSAIADLVDKPDKRPVIAPEGDRRKLWEGRAPEDMFEDES